MPTSSRDPILLTPGPLTTSLETRTAMLRDWGSWDVAFNAVTASGGDQCSVGTKVGQSLAGFGR